MSVLYPATPTLIGRSARINEIREKIARVGRSTAPVLLLGETGTGKEVVARAIHAVATEGPFVPIDCTILGTLLESELFGHTKGAFTGAVTNKPGLLETAENGTAFFDEVAELPLDVQVKLLRVMQHKEIRAVGAVVPRRANFRVIAATNRDPARAVERGAFRQDLYYRLNVVTLRLPPLRDRREDIPDLARHFLKTYGNGHDVSPYLEAALSAYDWPGNVRELENCIHRMCAMNSGPVLDVPDLPTALAGWLAGSDPPQAVLAAPASPSPVPPRVVPLEQMERQAILDALEFTGGDRARTAQLLGIGRTTLYRKLKRYGLDRD